MGVNMRAMVSVVMLLMLQTGQQGVECTVMRFTLKPTTQLGGSATNFPTFNDITVDLTGVQTLEFSFEAETGYQIELSLTDRSRFELQLSNMNSAMSGTMNTCAANTYLDASGQGSGNTGWIPTLA